MKSRRSLSCVALIPARAGSQRIPGKNIKLLAGYPLLAYTIAAAKESGIFTDILVSTEDEETGRLAVRHGSRWLVRPAAMATGTSPDLEWVRHALEYCAATDCFSILRPTSPFRRASTIRKAWSLFQAANRYRCRRKEDGFDSLRAVEPVKQHPYKMWWVNKKPYNGMKYDWMGTFEPGVGAEASQPLQCLTKIWVQNGSLEIAKTRIVADGTITGRHIMPFFAEGHEGFDLNTMADWREAEYLIASGEAILPEVGRATTGLDD